MNYSEKKIDNTNSAPLQGLGVITLENMEFHAYHGCMEHEKQLGNTFLVSVIMKLDTTKAGQTDELTDTLNYQLVYDTVKEQMEIPSRLIEHAGQRILDNIFNRFPVIQKLEVSLAKKNPPLGAKVEQVKIELSKSR